MTQCSTVSTTFSTYEQTENTHMYKHETQDIGLVQGIEDGYNAAMHPDVSRKCPGYKPPERHQVQKAQHALWYYYRSQT